MIRLLRGWLKRHEAEADLTEELRAHLEIEKRLRIEAGENPQEAERTARRLFGNVANLQEDTRQTWGWAPLERFISDIRFGGRMLRRTPAWTFVVCLTLALGIGLSTAVFSVVYGVMLRPLPYPEPARLVAIWPSWQASSMARFNVNATLWLRWRRDAKAFEDIALTRPVANFNLTGTGAPERLQGARSTPNLFSVLRVPPAAGRVFTEEERLADARVAVISHGLWIRRFGGDPGAVGSKVQLNGEPWTIIGVMPASFAYPAREFDLWAPLFIPAEEIQHRQMNQYISVARIRAGVTREQAQADLARIMHRLSEELPTFYRSGNDTLHAIVEPLDVSDTIRSRGMLWTLFAGTGCLLAIGCLNLSILLVARAGARSREMTVRAALGAGSGRLRRQIVAETLPLAAVGAAGGIIAAKWLTRALVDHLPANLPRTEGATLNLPVLAFSILVSALVVLLAALAPAGTAGSSGSRTVTGKGRTRRILVIAQVALTIVLLHAGVLFSHSLASMLAIDPGFHPDSVLTMHLAVTRAKYKTDPEVAAYLQRLNGRVAQLPGVVSVGIVNRLPLSGIGQSGGVEFEGMQQLADADWRSATPGYFQAMRIGIVRGRSLAETDTATSPRVGLIDERLAQQIYGGASPLGRRFRRETGSQTSEPWSEIVGVVRHVRNDGLDQDRLPQVYWPETQRTQDRGAMVVRVSGRPETIAKEVVQAIREEDPEQPVYDIRSMEDWVGRTTRARSLLAGLAGIFAGASLLLAGLGLFGTVSYTVGMRLREFGIRMALGSTALRVRLLVLRGAAGMTIPGCLLGLVLAWPAARLIRSELFQVRVEDPSAWIAAPAILIAIALAASLGPAGKAASQTPASTLRAE